MPTRVVTTVPAKEPRLDQQPIKSALKKVQYLIMRFCDNIRFPQKRLAGRKMVQALHLRLKTGAGTLRVLRRKNTRRQGETKICRKAKETKICHKAKKTMIFARQKRCNIEFLKVSLLCSQNIIARIRRTN